MRLTRLAVIVLTTIAVALLFAPTALGVSIYKSGSGPVGQTCAADLDAGTIDASCAINPIDPTKADIYFIAHTSTFRVIQYNNAGFRSKILKMSSKPTYATCAAAAVGFNEYKAAKNVGHWFCVLTSDGRFARLQITKVVAGGPMTIAFRTWCKPADAC